MVTLSAPFYDLNGAVVLPRTQESTMKDKTRRVSRAKTLDAGVALSDLGFSDGDRTLKIKSQKVSETVYAVVDYLQQNYPIVMLSSAEGMFTGSISSVRIRRGSLSLTYLVKEKIAEA